MVCCLSTFSATRLDEDDLLERPVGWATRWEDDGRGEIDAIFEGRVRKGNQRVGLDQVCRTSFEYSSLSECGIVWRKQKAGCQLRRPSTKGGGRLR